MALFDDWYDYINPLEYVRYGTDKLGITKDDADLRNSPEFKALQEAADAFKTRSGGLDTAAAETRGMDMDTIARLRAAEEGKTPSAAEALMRKAIDQNAGSALGIAATTGGFNPGFAMRAGLTAAADTGAKSAADIAALRASEMDAARRVLADQTRSASARDTGAAGVAAGQYGNAVAAPYQAMQTNDAANQALLGTLIGAGSQVGAAYLSGGKPAAPSDETLKTGVQPSPAMADDFLSSLKPKTFEFRQPGPNRPGGQQLGVIAQDLPQQNVVTGPDGKRWISADVIGSVLAGLGRVNQKVEEVVPTKKRKGQAGTVLGDEDASAAAKDYMTAPRRDAGTAGRVAGGRAPLPRSMQASDVAQGIDDPMVPRSAVHDYLAGLGIISP